MNWDLVIGVGLVVIAVAGYLTTRKVRGMRRSERLRDLRNPESADSVRESYESLNDRNTLGPPGQ